MRVISPSFKVVRYTPGMENLIELAGRTCYQSEAKTPSDEFISRLIDRSHLSVLEHAVITGQFIVDRGVSHELVRHRLASYSQSSTRYCDLSKDDIEFVKPASFLGPKEYATWETAMEMAENAYKALRKSVSPQVARAVLPNSLKTEIIMTANIREWRHVLALRCGSAAHPDMRLIMQAVRHEFIRRWPVLFLDLMPHTETWKDAVNVNRFTEKGGMK